MAGRRAPDVETPRPAPDAWLQSLLSLSWLELPWLLPAPSPPSAAAPGRRHNGATHRFLYFSGSDLWPQWAFAHGGVLWSSRGLDSEGFVLKLLASGGVYRYRSGALNDLEVIGRQYSLAALPGWRFKRGAVDLVVFAGLDLHHFRLLPNDPQSRLNGRHVGLRAGFELWYEPSVGTMLAADGSASSIGAGEYARVAYGWRLFDRFYIGPEAQIYRTDPYVHARFGAHITAFRFADREWSAALGYASDNDRRSGTYLRLSVLARR
ncbi:MAG TPA: cellulose biosynthesis protein BcsS [Xanthobacteraceae bacterium]|nr:cellulose biosynthesis protein BcsS [Xanthobacteraceae bacterium]